MAIDVLLDSNQILSRTMTGTITAVRAHKSYNANYLICSNPDPIPDTVGIWTCGGCAGSVNMSSDGYGISAKFIYTTEGDPDYEPPENPTCEDSASVPGIWRLWLCISCSSGQYVKQIASGGFGGLHDPEPQPSGSAVVTATLKLKADYYASFDGYSGTGGAEIYSGYPFYDNYGGCEKVEYWYKPKELTVSFTAPGFAENEGIPDVFLDLSDGSADSAWRHGFGDISLRAGASSLIGGPCDTEGGLTPPDYNYYPPWTDWTPPLPEPITAATATVNEELEIEAQDFEWGDYDSGEYMNFYFKCHYTGSGISAISTGGCYNFQYTPVKECGMDIVCPAYGIAYSGYVKNMDGEGVPGVKVRFGENHPDGTPVEGTTDSNGYVTGSRIYQGRGAVGLINQNWGNIITTAPSGVELNDMGNAIYKPNSSELWYSHSHGVYGIVNFPDLEGPEYGFSKGVNVLTHKNWYTFSDGKIEMPAGGAFSWPSAVTISVTEKMLLEFTELTGWSASSGVTLSLTAGGHLQAVVASDASNPSISNTYNTVFGSGARKLEVNFSSTQGTDDKIKIGVGGGTWEVTPGSKLDVLRPLDTIGVSANQSAMSGHDWAQGVQKFGALTFSNLKPGTTYVFSSIYGRRLTGGTIDVYLTDGHFVGDVTGDGRTADGQSIFYTQNECYTGRSGQIWVDEVYAAEVFSVYHIYVPGTFPYWRHPGILLNDSGKMYPTQGLITWNIPDGDKPWKKSSIVSSKDLVSGHYSGTNSVVVGVQMRARTVEVPFCNGSRSFSFNKVLGGYTKIKAIHSNGSKAMPVKIETFDRQPRNGETLAPLETRNLTTSAAGNLWVSALKCHSTAYGIITAMNTDGTQITVDGLSHTVGHRVAVPQYDDQTGWLEPVWRTITAYNNGVITLDGAVNYNAILIGNQVAVEIAYRHKITIGDYSQEISTRDRVITVANFALGELPPTGFTCLSAYQDRLSKEEYVGVGRADGGLSIYKMTDASSTLLDSSGMYPTLLLDKTGKALAWYTNTQDNREHASESQATWGAVTDTLIPLPDATAPSGKSWDKPVTLAGKLMEHPSGAAGGTKKTGQAYGAGWYKFSGVETGALVTVPVGKPGSSDQWTGWNYIEGLEVPLQMVDIVNEKRDRLIIFYAEGTGDTRILKAVFPQVDGQTIEGAGISGPISTLVASSESRHPSVVTDGHFFYMVTWEATAKTLKFRRFTLSGTTFTLEATSNLSNMIQNGDSPSSSLEEQKVGLYNDRNGRLRCFWWDGALKAATLYTKKEGV